MFNYNEDKEKIIQRYNDKLKTLKKDDLLSTGNDLRRNIRFKTLAEIGDFKGKKILDLGCGLGDFYKYLKDNHIDCEYTGYDINHQIISLAKEKYPNTKFEVIDIFEDEFPEFDYIVSTSSFNNKLEKVSNYDFIKEVLNICYTHSKEGVALDFLVSYVDYKHDYAFYYEPEKIFTFAKEVTRRISLRNDYTLFEFCIYLYRDMEFPYGKEYK